MIDIGRAEDADTSLAIDTKSHESAIYDPTAAAQHRSTQQRNYHGKQWQQGGKEEKGQGERDKGRKGEGGRGQEGRGKEKERETEVKKDVTDWTVLTKNRRQRKMIQIFVKVNGSNATPMEVNLKGVMRRIQKDGDAYVTMHGKVQKMSEKLKSCEVTDGCTIQVTSRMRGGGNHKVKKSRVEKKQTASAKTPEQKFVEEIRCDISPVNRECDKDATVTRQESMSDVNPETQKKNENKMIHVLDEDSTKSWVEFWSKESDNEVGQRMENWMSVLQGVKRSGC